MSNININVTYLKSWNGIFKLLQVVLGIVCVVIIGNEFNFKISIIKVINIDFTIFAYFLVATSTFFISTFILYISNLMSPSAASIIPKTIYEFLYHSIASILLLTASIAMMAHIHEYNNPRFLHYNVLLAASICGLLNSLLYIFSAIMGFSTCGND